MPEYAPIISVLVPTYNDAELLVRALESVQRQTFGDFEVLIGDDCSTNQTADLADVFCQTDHRFRCLRYPQNVGMTRHWNRLAKEATGSYVCKLDGDDFYQPETLERLFNSLQKNEAKVAFCRTIDCNANLEPVASYYGERAFLKHGIEPLDDYVRRGSEWFRLCFDGYQLWHSNAFLISRDIFQQLNGWDQRWGCASDTDFILRLLELNEKVCAIAYPGVLYRRRKGSVLDTFRQKSWHRMESAAVHLQSLERVYSNNPGAVRVLRRQWVRYWNTWCRESQAGLRGERNFDGLPAADVQISPPPVQYRFLGRLRELVNGARQLLRQ